MRRLLVFLSLLLIIACGGSRTVSSALTTLPLTGTAASPDAPRAQAPAPDLVVVGLVPVAWAASPAAVGGLAPPAVSAAAAVMLDEGSGDVLYEKEAHKPLPPASLTKIATAIAAIEQGGDLDATVETDVDSGAMRGSTVMGISPEDRFTLRDLLYGLLLPSGNDAALAIGRHVAASDAAFVDRLNALLARLGLSEAHFTNPHGLGGGATHVISAYDLAVLSRYAMTLAAFREVVAATDYVARGSRPLPLRNINTFLSYKGADGVKTGYTRGAGKTLVASASRDGHSVYVVVLNAPDRDGDASRLMTWAFTSFRWSESSQ